MRREREKKRRRKRVILIEERRKKEKGEWLFERWFSGEILRSSVVVLDVGIRPYTNTLYLSLPCGPYFLLHPPSLGPTSFPFSIFLGSSLFSKHSKTNPPHFSLFFFFFLYIVPPPSFRKRRKLWLSLSQNPKYIFHTSSPPPPLYMFLKQNTT